MFSIDTTTDPQRIAALEHDWRELEACDPVAVPGTYEFVSTWVRTRLRDPLYVVAIRQGSETVGVAPFVRVVRGVGPLRVPVLQYVTRNGYVPGVRALFRPDVASDAARALVEHLTDKRRRWSFVQLNNLVADGPLYRALRAKSEENGQTLRFGAQEHGVAIELPDEWDALTRLWNSNRRRTMSKRLAKLRAEHDVEIREVGRPDEVEDGLAAAFEIAAESWQGAQNTAISSRDVSREFYRELCTVFARQGRLGLWILSIDGKPASFHLALRSGETLYSLKWGYDQMWKAHGPGILVIGESMRDLVRRGVRRLEFFHPASDAKLAWGAQPTARLSLRIATDSITGRVLRAMESLREAPAAKPDQPDFGAAPARTRG
jgi:CelD/BcsL family acetyltransferase involved in cellulose biosynthesis